MILRALRAICDQCERDCLCRDCGEDQICNTLHIIGFTSCCLDHFEQCEDFKPVDLIQKMINDHMVKNILTCVYCGMAYPEGTPPHGSKVLTDHIKICEKHPLRQAEEKIKKLRTALIGLVGASEKAEPEDIEAIILKYAVPDTDKDNMINAIRVIIETADEDHGDSNAEQS